MEQITAKRRIPNIFHFVFGLKKQVKPFHLAHYLCLESCLQINDPEAVNFYFHYEPFGGYWDLIKEKLTLVKVELVDFVLKHKYLNPSIKSLKYAHQSDFIRLEKLLGQGGIYADMDTLFVNRIPDHLFTKSFVLGKEGDIFSEIAQTNVPSLCNAFIMAEPDAPFGKKWLQDQYLAFDGSWSKHSTLLPYKLSQRYPQDIHVEPSRSFYKHMWTKEGIHTLLQGIDKNYEGVISMHLWSHMWWHRWNRHFSDFHAGLLTEEYVRTVDTTYNIVARKYLPQSPSPGLWAGLQLKQCLIYIIANSIDILKDIISLATRSIFSRFPRLKQFLLGRGNRLGKRTW